MKWLATVLFVSGVCFAAEPRARDLGVPFEGQPGPLNAITDVKGVEVGHATIISGQGERKVGVGPVRTRVTAIFPRGKGSAGAGVFADWFALNGNGERLARRASLGIARTGGVSMNGSGDIFVAFSTANQTSGSQVAMLPNERINPLIEATVQATEEAIINALVAAKTMVGINDRRVVGLPHQRLREVLKRYGRLVPF